MVLHQKSGNAILKLKIMTIHYNRKRKFITLLSSARGARISSTRILVCSFIIARNVSNIYIKERNDKMHGPNKQVLLHIYFEVESWGQHFPIPLPTCGGSRQQKPITQPWMQKTVKMSLLNRNTKWRNTLNSRFCKLFTARLQSTQTYSLAFLLWLRVLVVCLPCYLLASCLSKVRELSGKLCTISMYYLFCHLV